MLYPFKLRRSASKLSLYEVCSLSSEYSLAYAVLRLVISFSYYFGIASHFLFIITAKWDNIALCSLVKFIGIIFISSGLASFESQFKDSSNATLRRLTPARFAPSTKNNVFQ